MLFYDYEKIYILARGNSSLIVQIIRRMVDDPEAHVMLTGRSFILNENTIVYNKRKLSDRQLAEYLGLLSFRNYAEYSFSKDASLDMQYIPPWVPRAVIEHHPLIAINKSKLTFIEEN